MLILNNFHDKNKFQVAKKLADKNHEIHSFKYTFELHLHQNRMVVTKFWLKYYRSIQKSLLMFFILWIMVVSRKLKKYLIVQNQSLQKRLFFGGMRSGGLKYRDLRYVSGHEQHKFLCSKWRLEELANIISKKVCNEIEICQHFCFSVIPS